jgi:hypothetical protein
MKTCVDCGKQFTGVDYFGACKNCPTPTEIITFMKRFIIRIRQTRKREWLLVEDFVTAAHRTAANAIAAARYPRYWVKTQEVTPVADLEQLETLGELSITNAEETAERARGYRFVLPTEHSDLMFEDEERFIMHHADCNCAECLKSAYEFNEYDKQQNPN